MLYLRQATPGASPKAISGRTSYLRVRLEFLPYPRLIATFFNTCAFGPPLPFTAASAWVWIGHPVSGLHCDTLLARFALGFPSAPRLRALNLASHCNSPDRSTKSTRSPPLRGSRRLRTKGFRFSFTPLPGFFSPFPHGTASLSVARQYLGLGVVPPASHRVPRVPWYSGSRAALSRFRVRGFHPLWPAFPKPFRYRSFALCAVLNPQRACPLGLASSRFARRYSGNHCCFLFLPLLRCFSSRRSPRTAMDLPCGDRVLPGRVPPFGYPRISGCMRLPAAFRSFLRPSSAPGAKAFSLCPSSLVRLPARTVSSLAVLRSF